MTAEKLAVLAGIILSLLFSYIPGLSDWFGKLEGIQKRLVMLALLLVVAAGAFGLSCAQVITEVTCDQAGAMGLVQAFIAAVIANQATYLISPQKAAKALPAPDISPQ